jgi:proline racemase
MRYDKALWAIEFHTGGQGMRLLTAGLGQIPGATMRDKQEHFRSELDHVRTGLCREPRGHRDMLMAVLTAPVSDGADFGLIFVDGMTYLDSCGEATIGSVTAALETGLVQQTGAETEVAVDTVDGEVRTVAHVEGGRVRKVTMRLGASYVALTDQWVKVEDLGDVPIDVCVGAGNVFGLVKARDLDVTINQDNAGDVLAKGLVVRKAANEQLELDVVGLKDREVEMIEITGAIDQDGVSRNAVIWGPGAVDRAPCGTGTCARLALLKDRGELPDSGILVHEGILGTRFEGSIAGTVDGEAGPAVLPAISGTAYVTGFSQYVFQDEDPVSDGYLLSF